MEEKKEFNAKEGLKGFDPTAKGSGPRLFDLLLKEKITTEEWDDYSMAKNECESRGGNWKSERNEKHDRIARIYYEACKEYESRYEQ